MLSAIGSFGNHVVNTENTISHRFNRKKVNKLWLFFLFCLFVFYKQSA